jgi:hypothetical protein
MTDSPIHGPLVAISAQDIVDTPTDALKDYAASCGWQDERALHELSTSEVSSARALAARLLTDSERIGQMLGDPDPWVRRACLASSGCPRDAVDALVGLSPNPHYGQGTAVDLYYLTRNPELSPEQLRAILERVRTEDPHFWAAAEEESNRG